MRKTKRRSHKKKMSHASSREEKDTESRAHPEGAALPSFDSEKKGFLVLLAFPVLTLGPPCNHALDRGVRASSVSLNQCSPLN
jgi:hypothetical protein